VNPASGLKPIVVYIVERHPLDIPETGPIFRWLHTEDDFRRQLEGLIGPFDPDDLTILTDTRPAGDAWKALLEALIQESVRTVVTHLAPLSSAQRQQLIGVCAQTGARLITPADAGRNRPGSATHHSV
jgi:hypothetical protein